MPWGNRPPTAAFMRLGGSEIVRLALAAGPSCGDVVDCRGGGLDLGQLLPRLAGLRFRTARKLPARADDRIMLEIILVLRLGLPEGTHRRQLRHDLTRPKSGRLDICDRIAATRFCSSFT